MNALVMQKLNCDKMNHDIQQSWSKIAPYWPLKNLIAVNPLYGFENFSFEDALLIAQAYFQQKDLPEPMHIINRETIKWLQVFFDEGQATIKMPQRHLGLLNAVRFLLPFDKNIFGQHNKELLKWLKDLSELPQKVIAECLLKLEITDINQEQYLTLMLSTLPGWTSYIQYRTTWAGFIDQKCQNLVTKEEYIALRLLITYLLWPKGKILLDWHTQARKNTDNNKTLHLIEKAEITYHKELFKKLSKKPTAKKSNAEAQLVFCIDVRSEPFRRALEDTGKYETFGFAGFFGIPVNIDNTITGESYASCPVLLKPVHTIKEHPSCSDHSCKKNYDRKKNFKKIYQSLKYNFTTPFALVETLGMISGLWMTIQNLFPNMAYQLKRHFEQPTQLIPHSESIPFDDQCNYAENALKMMGLTADFSPIVVFCGHGSTTQNNAYATALNCGACGGQHGGPNAHILASILNKEEVRNILRKRHINIPNTTYFVASEHDTTTDKVELYEYALPENFKILIEELKYDLQKAREQNSQWRCQKMGEKYSVSNAAKHTTLRAHDWAQVRPEWGLARNASLIIGPRTLTRDINLDGRSFLHSYNWMQDLEGIFLTTILTAPMIVAHWISQQYIFSTLDNVAFGGGSKITKNITGKIGIMQGNASDLMHGLPLQSVYKTDKEAYHEPLRLMTIVYAPRSLIDRIIIKQDILKKLFGNGWVKLGCIEPETHTIYNLQRDLKWTKAI